MAEKNPVLARRAKASGRSGLSIVELLVAITILAIGLTAYVKLSLVSRVAVDKGDYYSAASAFASNTLDGYKGQGYSNVVSQMGTSNSTVSGLPKGKMAVTVGYLGGNSSNSNIVEVDVTISWGYGLSSETGSITQSLLLCAPAS